MRRLWRWLIGGTIVALGSGGAWLVHVARRPTPLPASSAAPLTDMAARAPAVNIGPGEGPPRPPPAPPPTLAASTPPAIPPAQMPDPQHPPQWSAPIAVPGSARPPNPAVPPPMAVDPNRGRE